MLTWGIILALIFFGMLFVLIQPDVYGILMKKLCTFEVRDAQSDINNYRKA